MHTRFSPDDERALGLGLLAQPLVAGAVGFALSSWSVQMGIVMGVIFAIVAAIITVCVAYPLLLWFIRRGSITLASTILSGAVLGNIPAAIAAVGSVTRSQGIPDLGTLIRPIGVGTVTGILCASAFWMLSGQRLSGRRT